MMRSATMAAAALAATAAILPCAGAQDYPTRPVRVIVPYAPGGGSDILARFVAPKAAEELGQQFVIDNRPGAASTIGTQLIARATPDGYTIGMIDTALSINPGLFAKLPYDAARDFAPVTLVATSPLLFVVHPSVPAGSVKELVALAKAKPGQLNISSAGNGTAAHLAGEVFRAVAAIDVIHVPYKGAGPQVVDLVGGQSMMGFTTPASAMPHVKAGKLRGFGISGTKRSGAIPGVATMGELGYPVEVTPYWGLVAPAGVPPATIRRLNAAFAKHIRAPEFRDRLIELAFDPGGNSPEEFTGVIRDDTARYLKVIKAAGIKVE